MSHIVSVTTQVKDSTALAAACQRLRLKPPLAGTHRLFAGEVEGLAVELPDWRYPAVFQLEMGAVQYDTFEGRWGDTAELDRLMQAYAVERARMEARRAGHSVVETPLTDGSIKLTITVGGAA